MGLGLNAMCDYDTSCDLPCPATCNDSKYFNTLLYSSSVFKRFGCHHKVTSDASQKLTCPLFYPLPIYLHIRTYVHAESSIPFYIIIFTTHDLTPDFPAFSLKVLASTNIFNIDLVQLH